MSSSFFTSSVSQGQDEGVRNVHFLEPVVGSVPSHDSYIGRPIMLGELASALSSVKTRLAHGPDLIPNIALKNLPDNFISLLLKVFKAFLHNKNIS